MIYRSARMSTPETTKLRTKWRSFSATERIQSQVLHSFLSSLLTILLDGKLMRVRACDELLTLITEKLWPSCCTWHIAISAQGIQDMLRANVFRKFADIYLDVKVKQRFHKSNGSLSALCRVNADTSFLRRWPNFDFSLNRYTLTPIERNSI